MTRATKLAVLCVLMAAGAFAAFALAPAGGAQEGSTGGADTGPPTTTEPEPPAADMPLAEFREKRVALKTRVNEIRDGKCRRPVAFARATGDIDPLRRAENLGYWRARVERNRERRSVCYPAVMRRKYERMPDYRQAQWWRIHSCEGSWKDPAAPYYGGLQMGWTFMETYGRDALRYYGGPANRWHWFVQVVVADRAVGPGYIAGGFAHWPNCGRAYY